jgi:hypothetical protein
VVTKAALDALAFEEPSPQAAESAGHGNGFFVLDAISIVSS